jgi:hypothetical protein
MILPGGNGQTLRRTNRYSNLFRIALITLSADPARDRSGGGGAMGPPGRCSRDFGMKWRAMWELVGSDGTVGVQEVGGRAAVAEYAPWLIGLTLGEGQASARCLAGPFLSSTGGGSLPSPGSGPSRVQHVAQAVTRGPDTTETARQAGPHRDDRTDPMASLAWSGQTLSGSHRRNRRYSGRCSR